MSISQTGETNILKENQMESLGKVLCTENGRKLFAFPKNEEIRKIWLNVVPVSQNLTKNSVVCSLHFKSEAFYIANSRQMLKGDAIPSVFPVPSTSKRLTGDGHTWMDIKKDVRSNRFEDFDSDDSSTTISASIPTISSNAAKLKRLKKNVRSKRLEDVDSDDSSTTTNASEPMSSSAAALKPWKKKKVDQEPSQQMSTGVKCNECGKEMFGFRLKCIECFSYEMCGDCDDNGVHSDHYILRVPAHKPQEEAAQLVKILRLELQLEIPEEPEIKSELKEEIPDPLEEAEHVVPFTRHHPDNPIEQPMINLNLENAESSLSLPLSMKRSDDAPIKNKGEQAQVTQPTISVVSTSGMPTLLLRPLTVSQPSAPKRSEAVDSSPAPKRQAIAFTAKPSSQSKPKIAVLSCQVTSRSDQGASKTSDQRAGSHGQNTSTTSQEASSQAAASAEDPGYFSFAVLSHSSANKAKGTTVKKKS